MDGGNDRCDRLRKEEMIFLDWVKNEVEEELGSWSISLAQNELADRRITISVQKSHKYYAYTGKHYERNMFEFKICLLIIVMLLFELC